MLIVIQLICDHIEIWGRKKTKDILKKAQLDDLMHQLIINMALSQQKNFLEKQITPPCPFCVTLHFPPNSSL